MGLFSGKNPTKSLMKHTQQKGYVITNDGTYYRFEIRFEEDNLSLFPYFVIDEDKNIFSICINLKKVLNDKEINYQKIIDFNNNSRFFTLKFENNVLFLEYNTYFDDNLENIFDLIIENVFMLRNLIKNL